MASKFDMCKIDRNGIYLPKEFIEQVLEDFRDRYMTHNDAGRLFTAGRLCGGMDVYEELLKKINELED